MAEIKLEAQGSNQNIQEQKPRANLKAAIQLAQKQQLEIIRNLEHLHNTNIIKPIYYDQQKTQLQKYIDLPSEMRNRKISKNIKAELSYLPCFQVHAQSEMPKELLAIMKRDVDMLIAVISKFVYPSLYPKGSIIQSVCASRKSVKILLKGQIYVFEPINYKSYKNCLKKAKQSQIKFQWIQDILSNINLSLEVNSLVKSSKQQQKQLHFNHEEIESQVVHNMQDKHKALSQQLCRRILMNSGVITPTTPHRQTMHIRQPGHLISSERQPYIVNQTKTFEHTAICLTEAYVLQIEYDIYKTAISLLNSDEEKRYIQTLLKKFQMLEYFDAKQYVKKQYMIDKKRQEMQEKKKQQEAAQHYASIHEQLLITRQLEPRQKIIIQNAQSEQSETSSKKDKSIDQQIDIETYEIKYDSDVYLIIFGEVTIMIDKIGQRRLSNLQHASKIRSFQSHQLIKLYATDVFGFQQIGKVKQYNLRYRINKNSKLLLLSENIYVKHFTQILGFRLYFKALQSQRNMLISSILQKIESSIQKEQLKKYQSLSILQHKFQKTPTHSNKAQKLAPFHSENIIKRVQFVGRSQFQAIQSKLVDKLAKQKQGKTTNISFKQMIKTGKQLKESLTFASIYKSHLPKNCQIKGNYIQVRNKDGILKRRKCIIEGNNHQYEKQKQVFRKLGIISDEDRNNHNFALISSRKSKYELEDFAKQKKEMNRLRQISQSLPKLNYFYAKKEQILYNNIHKRDS